MRSALFSPLLPDLWLSHLCAVCALHPYVRMQFNPNPSRLSHSVCGWAGLWVNGCEGRFDCASHAANRHRAAELHRVTLHRMMTSSSVRTE